MAIQLECISFIIPIKTIKEKYPGSWAQCLEDHKNLIGGRVWYDDHLFRDGAMNPMDIGTLVDEWTTLGFWTHYEQGETPTKWIDVCVVESIFGTTLPCDWIELDGFSAYMKDTVKGEIIGRDYFVDIE